MTDSTSGTRTPPPPPPPKKRPPPPPPPPKKPASAEPSLPPSQPPPPPKPKAATLPASNTPPEAASPASKPANKSRVPIVVGVAALLLVTAGTGTWFYMDYAKKAEEVRVAQEKVKQEEDLKKQEADKVAKAAADLKEQVAAVFSQSKVPLDRASPHIQLMLDGSAANNEQAIVSAQREIDALPKPSPSDVIQGHSLAYQASELSSKGNYAAAIPLLLKAAGADQTDVDVWLLLTMALIDAGDLQGAGTAVRHALTLGPSLPGVWHVYGSLNAVEGKKEASAAAFLNFVRFSKDKKDARANLEALVANEKVVDAVRDSIKAVLASSALMLIESRVAPAAVAKPENVEVPHPQQASANTTPTASAQKSWSVPGRITAATPIRAAGSTSCQPADLERVEHTGRVKNSNEIYCIVAVSNQAAPDGSRVRHTWASDYPYVQGTTLYMRVFEDGRIVVE